MREVKFRAWDNSIKKMNYEPATYVHETDSINLAICNWSNDVFMQYTGLKDKNGVEIYEGDIVRYGVNNTYPGQNARKAPGQVVWQRDGAYYRIKDIRSDSGISWNAYGNELWCEVIGNIYDNPELLEQSA